jgi:hypothetical protein
MINVTVVLDESGSMASKREETIRGLNKYIEDLQKSGQDMILTIFRFNSYHCLPVRSCPVSQATSLTEKEYEPDGMTPLYDVLGSVLENPSDTDNHTIFVIITDGLENDSKRFNREQISKLIGHLQEVHKWEFVYLGANQDAWVAGAQIGIHQHNTMKWNPNQTRRMYHGLSGATVAYAANVVAGIKTDFFEGWDEKLGEETPDSN